MRLLFSILVLFSVGCNSDDSTSGQAEEESEQAQGVNDLDGTQGDSPESAEEEEVPIAEINPEDIEIVDDAGAPAKKEEKTALYKKFTTRVTEVDRKAISTLNGRMRAKAMRALRTEARKAGYYSTKKGQKITQKRCTRGENSKCAANVTITFVKYK